MDQSTDLLSGRILILGALSGVAEATARKLAGHGGRLALVGRRAERLENLRDDLRVRGAADVRCYDIDLVAEAHKAQQLSDIAAEMGGIDAVLVFYGALGDQTTADHDINEVARIIDVNFTSAVQWITAVIPFLDASSATHPTILAVSSVAGDRGRRSNYAYGAAKGGLSVFMQGLAHRFAKDGRLRAVTIKMGFVKTAMTAHLDNDGPLWIEPDDAADAIVDILKRKGSIFYVPWFWRFIMLAVRSTPSFIFNKINL